MSEYRIRRDGDKVFVGALAISFDRALDAAKAFDLTRAAYEMGKEEDACRLVREWQLGALRTETGGASVTRRRRIER